MLARRSEQNRNEEKRITVRVRIDSATQQHGQRKGGIFSKNTILFFSLNRNQIIVFVVNLTTNTLIVYRTVNFVIFQTLTQNENPEFRTQWIQLSTLYWLHFSSIPISLFFLYVIHWLESFSFLWAGVLVNIFIYNILLTAAWSMYNNNSILWSTQSWFNTSSNIQFIHFVDNSSQPTTDQAGNDFFLLSRLNRHVVSSPLNSGTTAITN